MNWIIVNVEHWGMERPMPRSVLSPPMGQPMQPDLPNWAWHEYGMRVGIWRMMEALKKRRIIASTAMIAATAIGGFTQKMECQLKCSSRTPPRTRAM